MTLDPVVKSIERFDFLDGVASSIAGVVGKFVRPQVVRNLLSGTYIGHPLHPVLTDIPIGAWTMAAFLDLAGGKASEPAAGALVAVGIAAAIQRPLPASMTGQIRKANHDAPGWSTR